jgi:flagellar basal-body rod protein FlgB
MFRVRNEGAELASMDPKDLTAFRVIKQRLQWLGQRQEVLAHNVANADTPKFRPSDLQPFSFRMAMGQESKMRPATTQAGHVTGTRPRGGQDVPARTDRNFYETSPDGNQVVVEQQMMKIADTGVNYNLVTNLYRRQMGMFKMVLGRSQ